MSLNVSFKPADAENRPTWGFEPIPDHDGVTSATVRRGDADRFPRADGRGIHEVSEQQPTVLSHLWVPRRPRPARPKRRAFSWAVPSRCFRCRFNF